MTLIKPEQCALFVLDTDWSGYQKILEVVEERPIRVTYDRGRLELMSPGRAHERAKKILGALLECIMTELEIDFEPGGSTTFKREDLDRGFEPDECYWIEQWEAVRGRREWSAAVDPPPDLAIEVEVTSRVIRRLPIYQAIGIPEVWRLTKDLEVLFLVLKSDGYAEVPHSPHFPWLGSTVLTQWLARDLPQPRLVRAFREELSRLQAH